MTDASRLVLPALWLGLVLGVSFIETPLKFRVEGMPLAAALRLGRAMFTALNLAGFLILTLMTVVHASTPGDRPTMLVLLFLLWVVLLVEVLVLRPMLASRTNRILDGGTPRRSRFHLTYVVAEIVLVVLLVLYTIGAAS